MKRIILISLLFITAFGSAQVSRNRLKTTGYGWINRVVPPNGFLDSTFASFHNIISDGIAATATNAIAFTNKTGNISQWTNDVPYATSATLSGYVPNTRQLTINGTAFDLSANRAWTVGDALVANPLSQFAATTSSQLAGVITDETGTGVAVFNTAPTFVTSITSPIVQGGTSSGGNITIKSTSSISPGNIIFNTSTAAIFGVGGNKKMSIGSISAGASLDVTQTNTTSGAAHFIDFRQGQNTGQTASTEIYGFRLFGGGKQWATGNLAIQRESYFSTTTYSAVGASVFTDVYGMYVEAPTAGTNVTITNPWALGLVGNLSVVGNIVKSGGLSTQFLKADGSVDATTYAVSGTNWAITGNSGFTYGTNFLGTTGNESVLFKTNNTEVGKLDSLGNFYIKRNLASSVAQVKIIAQNTSSVGISSINCYDEAGLFQISLSQFNKHGGVGTLYDDSTGYLSVYEKHTGIINEYPTGDILFATGGYGASREAMRISKTLNVGISGAASGKVTVPTAILHLGYSSGYQPLRFNSGTLMTGTNVIAGGVEFLTDKWYGTITTGAVQKEFTMNDGALTSGRVVFSTTNGRLTDNSILTFDGTTLTAKRIAISGLSSGAYALDISGTSTPLNISSSNSNSLKIAISDAATVRAYWGATSVDYFTVWDNAANSIKFRIDNSGNLKNLNYAFFGGTTVPTARVHIAAGTAAASTAPQKFTTGTLLTTAEAGAKEYNNAFFSTKSSGLRYGEGGVIADFYTDTQNGTTVETDLYSYTTPANTLEADGGKIMAQYSGTFNDLTATAQLKIYFGGTVIGNTGALTVSATGGWNVEVFIIRTSSTTARAVTNVSTPGASTAVYTAQTDITGLTLSSTNIIKITGTAGGASGGSSDITGKLGTVSWMPAANN